MTRRNRHLPPKDLVYAQTIRRLRLVERQAEEQEQEPGTAMSGTAVGWILWGVLVTFIAVLVAL